MDEPKRIAVLASGGGTNLQSLLDRFNAAASPVARVALVVGSRRGIGALERAERAGVPAVVLSVKELGAEAYTEALLTELGRRGTDLVVLAGFLQLVPLAVVERYEGRMVNVHPALLPAFGGAGMYGIRVHRAVIESGARVSGATVHRVGAEYDTGAILAQWPVPVLPGDTPEALAARVLAVEHRLLPLAVEALARGEAPQMQRFADPVAFELVPRAHPADESIRGLSAF
ncbi:MAG TPA: phosphoribosylglycinamide formyltransferase [Longimicrobiaceae bacterium]|nr:phosphoribosylglycinamide formyltransferase [Longimicrobiaceae bacterium]